ncbi:hypothetical protein IQ247_04450 [Plectonema cf. radiosum LEGE 06105]|uniref:Uncharacterized protein n=2 Tax=Plectonema TaxID=1183 RepID=A0A8J7JTC4_9CYAN|nr:hypothetical protein [Plectonema cf. radiosum LEGE 06105]
MRLEGRDSSFSQEGRAMSTTGYAYANTLSIYLAMTSTYEPFHKRIRISFNVITQLGKIFWGWVVALAQRTVSKLLVVA